MDAVSPSAATWISHLTRFTADEYLRSPVSIGQDTFENTSEDEIEDLSDQVSGVLAANDDRAFKPREIAIQIGVDEGAVSTALSRLMDRALVDHKTTY
jgi:DNA-directed RNA polymerase specialized sigma24 family protein